MSPKGHKRLYHKSMRFQPVSAAKVQARVADIGYARVEVLEQVTSTNALLMNEPERYGHGTVLIAEEQTAGRGRRGKAWISPQGLNVYMSIAHTWRKPFEQLQGLSVAIGVALTTAGAACARCACRARRRSADSESGAAES